MRKNYTDIFTWITSGKADEYPKEIKEWESYLQMNIF